MAGAVCMVTTGRAGAVAGGGVLPEDWVQAYNKTAAATGSSKAGMLLNLGWWRVTLVFLIDTRIERLLGA